MILSDSNLIIYATSGNYPALDETVTGFVQATITPGVEGDAFNLGVGEAIRIGGLANKVVEKIARKIKILITPESLRPEKSEVLRLISNYWLARETLGWYPKVGLDENLDQNRMDFEEHRALPTRPVPFLIQPSPFCFSLRVCSANPCGFARRSQSFGRLKIMEK